MEIGKTVKIFDPTTFVLSLHSLPEDIQLHIFSLLSRKELHIASRVCQRWRKICCDNRVFSKVFNLKADLIGLWDFSDSSQPHLDKSGITKSNSLVKSLVDNSPTLISGSLNGLFGNVLATNSQTFIKIPVSDISQYQTETYTSMTWCLIKPQALVQYNTVQGWRTVLGAWNHVGNHNWMHLGYEPGMYWGNQLMKNGQTKHYPLVDTKHGVEVNEWTHVATVVTPRYSRLFVNGKLVKEISFKDSHNEHLNLPNEVYIGCKNSDFHNPWIGLIGDVAIFSRPLERWEISTIYEEGKTNSKGIWSIATQVPVLSTLKM